MELVLLLEQFGLLERPLAKGKNMHFLPCHCFTVLLLET